MARRARWRRLLSLTLGSVLAARLMFAALLVFGTYNPSGPSYEHWLATGTADVVWKIVAGGVLAVAYGIVVPVSLRALGFGGVVLTAAAWGSLMWVLVGLGAIDLAAPHVATWLALALATVELGVGLTWMRLAAALDGQKRRRDLTR